MTTARRNSVRINIRQVRHCAQIRKGNDQGKWEVEVYGFDYYNPRKGTIESGDDDRGIESLGSSQFSSKGACPVVVASGSMRTGA
jgi:hypothetical protein